MIRIEPDKVFLFVDEFADLQATTLDARGNPAPFDPTQFEFAWESSDENIAEVTADPADSARGLVRAVGVGSAGAETTLRRLPSGPEVGSPASATVNVFDMNGTWRLTYTGTDNDCEPPAPIPAPETVTISQTGDQLTLINPNFGANLTGTIMKTSATEEPPYDFELLPPKTSTQSLKCQEFFNDIAGFLGPLFVPPCDAAAQCIPLSCQESQAADGTLQADGRTATGRVGWKIEFAFRHIAFPPFGPVITNVAESCEGLDFFNAAKQ